MIYHSARIGHIFKRLHICEGGDDKTAAGMNMTSMKNNHPMS